MDKLQIPKPLFDNIEYLKKREMTPPYLSLYSTQDFKLAQSFLQQYDGNQATFINYRKEVERLFHWSCLIAKKSILALRREDIENYIKFCQNPPKSWVGLKTVPRFINKKGERTPHPEWRPFVATISKSDIQRGKKPLKEEYVLSQKSVKEIFVIIGSFYSYLMNENVSEMNPVLQIRQKSKFIRKQQNAPKIPRLSDTQWKCLIEATQILADENPDRHERTLFIITAMYLMYLRISELVASHRWTPIMGHFYKDSNNNWWFATVGKGNKERHVTVSDGMLSALKRWREYLGLTPLPFPQDQHPLIPKTKGRGPISSIRLIRKLIQECFDAATQHLLKEDNKEEAATMTTATVHWLRHTGISDDINKRGRPIIHVRDDAGHASIATTDRYNDVILRERHSSGKNKKI